jgi:arsenate reductase
MVTIYGIPNCDTMKKARAWLTGHGIEHVFHDYRKDGIDADTVRGWLARTERSVLVNTRGTTWRKLTPEQQQIDGDEAAIALMLAHPSLIKRPVLDTGDALIVGFKADLYAAQFGV